MNYLQKKKLAFMSIVNSVKGFIRTITGVFPLTLTNCVDEESITDYTIYGNSVQNGTPKPDTPIEVECVGERTKNLFDINTFITLDGNSEYYAINENGELVQKKSDYRDNKALPVCAILPAGTYRLSKYGNWSNTRIFNKNTNTAFVSHYFTITEQTEIALKWWNSTGTVIGKPQLEQGDTATAYEPYGYKIPVMVGGNDDTVITNIYLDEPLRKVGNYVDYIDFEKGKVVRNVKRVELKNATVTYDWSGKKGVAFSQALDGNYNRSVGWCNRNNRWTANGDEPYSIWLGVVTRTIYWVGILNYLGLTTLAQMNEWLANNPTYVYYGTDNPTETPITLPTIPTFKGTSIISADTTIQPSNAEIEYYSNVKE